MASIKDLVVNAFSSSSPVGITLQPGTLFPLADLRTVMGTAPALPSDGERTVLWFYPKDNTPG